MVSLTTGPLNPDDLMDVIQRLANACSTLRELWDTAKDRDGKLLTDGMAPMFAWVMACVPEEVEGQRVLASLAFQHEVVCFHAAAWQGAMAVALRGLRGDVLAEESGVGESDTDLEALVAGDAERPTIKVVVGPAVMARYKREYLPFGKAAKVAIQTIQAYLELAQLNELSASPTIPMDAQPVVLAAVVRLAAAQRYLLSATSLAWNVMCSFENFIRADGSDGESDLAAAKSRAGHATRLLNQAYAILTSSAVVPLCTTVNAAVMGTWLGEAVDAARLRAISLRALLDAVVGYEVFDMASGGHDPTGGVRTFAVAMLTQRYLVAQDDANLDGSAYAYGLFQRILEPILAVVLSDLRAVHSVALPLGPVVPAGGGGGDDDDDEGALADNGFPCTVDNPARWAAYVSPGAPTWSRTFELVEVVAASTPTAKPEPAAATPVPKVAKKEKKRVKTKRAPVVLGGDSSSSSSSSSSGSSSASDSDSDTTASSSSSDDDEEPNEAGAVLAEDGPGVSHTQSKFVVGLPPPPTATIVVTSDPADSRTAVTTGGDDDDDDGGGGGGGGGGAAHKKVPVRA